MAKVSHRTAEKFFRAVKENGGVECSQYPNLFVPDEISAHGAATDYEFLKTVCQRCPVQSDRPLLVVCWANANL